MSLWKWMKHGQRRCTSAYFWEGFGCGAVTFVMLAIHAHCEQLRRRQRRGHYYAALLG